MTFPSSQGDLSAQPGRTGEHGIRHLDPNNSILVFVSIDLLWLPPISQVWITAQILETPFVLTALPHYPLRLSPYHCFPDLFLQKRHLFQIIVPLMFWVLLLQSNYIWLFPAYIPDLRLLLFCFAIFIWTSTPSVLHHSCIIKSIISVFQWSQRNSDLGLRSPRFISWDDAMWL